LAPIEEETGVTKFITTEELKDDMIGQKATTIALKKEGAQVLAGVKLRAGETSVFSIELPTIAMNSSTGNKIDIDIQSGNSFYISEQGEIVVTDGEPRIAVVNVANRSIKVIDKNDQERSIDMLVPQGSNTRIRVEQPSGAKETTVGYVIVESNKVIAEINPTDLSIALRSSLDTEKKVDVKLPEDKKYDIGQIMLHENGSVDISVSVKTDEGTMDEKTTELPLVSIDPGTEISRAINLEDDLIIEGLRYVGAVRRAIAAAGASADEATVKALLKPQTIQNIRNCASEALYNMLISKGINKDVKGNPTDRIRLAEQTATILIKQIKENPTRADMIRSMLSETEDAGMIKISHSDKIRLISDFYGQKASTYTLTRDQFNALTRKGIVTILHVASKGSEKNNHYVTSTGVTRDGDINEFVEHNGKVVYATREQVAQRNLRDNDEYVVLAFNDDVSGITPRPNKFSDGILGSANVAAFKVDPMLVPTQPIVGIDLAVLGLTRRASAFEPGPIPAGWHATDRPDIIEMNGSKGVERTWNAQKGEWNEVYSGGLPFTGEIQTEAGPVPALDLELPDIVGPEHPFTLPGALPMPSLIQDHFASIEATQEAALSKDGRLGNVIDELNTFIDSLANVYAVTAHLESLNLNAIVIDAESLVDSTDELTQTGVGVIEGLKKIKNRLNGNVTTAVFMMTKDPARRAKIAKVLRTQIGDKVDVKVADISDIKDDQSPSQKLADTLNGGKLKGVAVGFAPINAGMFEADVLSNEDDYKYAAICGDIENTAEGYGALVAILTARKATLVQIGDIEAIPANSPLYPLIDRVKQSGGLVLQVITPEQLQSNLESFLKSIIAVERSM